MIPRLFRSKNFQCISEHTSPLESLIRLFQKWLLAVATPASAGQQEDGSGTITQGATRSTSMLQAPQETGLASGTPVLLRLCAALADGHGGCWDAAPARSLHPAHQRLWPWVLSHPCLLALCHSPPVKLPFSPIFQAPPSPHLLGLPSARHWGLTETGTKSRVVASTPGLERGRSRSTWAQLLVTPQTSHMFFLPFPCCTCRVHAIYLPGTPLS